MAVQIQLRGDTAANWEDANPILADREPGLDMDGGVMKVGDGATAWNDLDAFIAPGGGGLVLPTRLTFNSGGSQSGDRYNTWEDYLARLATIRTGTAVTVFEQSETVPPGTEWDWNGRIEAAYPFDPGGVSGNICITFTEGVVVSGIVRYPTSAFGLVLYNAADTTTPITLTNAPGGQEFYAQGCTLMAKAAPLVKVDGASLAPISLANSSIIRPSSVGVMDGDYEAVEYVTGTAFNIIAPLWGRVTIGQDTIRCSDGGQTMYVFNSSPALQLGTQANWAGGVTQLNTTAGSAIGVTPPSGSGNLTTGVTDVQKLLDEVDNLDLGAGAAGALAVDDSQLPPALAGTVTQQALDNILATGVLNLTADLATANANVTSLLPGFQGVNGDGTTVDIDNNVTVIEVDTTGAVATIRLGNPADRSNQNTYFWLTSVIFKAGGNDLVVLNHDDTVLATINTVGVTLFAPGAADWTAQ